jgi:hypothetical protein
MPMGIGQANEPQMIETTARRKRTIVGKVFLWIFITWNVVMLVCIGVATLQYDQLFGIEPVVQFDNEPLTAEEVQRVEQIMAIDGVGMAIIGLTIFWALGAIIFGIPALLTRGKRA